ncbi:uncharacterized protein [Ptychodera flava]|uniref:uncharacterized protein n=1 Tax=Ptychodera flava TaxID=63121 RepID=UPI003969D7D3
MPSALKMGSKRKQISLCLLLCILVLNLGVDSKPLKQRDGYSHGTHLEDIEDIGKSHRGDGWTKNFKPHSKYMPVIDLIKEKMEKCKTYPNDKLCGPGRTKYLPNLADEDNDVLSFDIKDEVSANYILRSAELYLNVVTSNQDFNLSDVTTSTDRMTLNYDTKQILRLSSGSENRSENNFKIELDVTDETILFLEAGISDRFNFTADVAGHHLDLSAFLILKLERILSGRPLVFDLLWPPKNVSRIADNVHQHHGSRSRRLVSKVTSRRICRSTK